MEVFHLWYIFHINYHICLFLFFYCQSAVLLWSILLVCHLLYVQYIHAHYKYFSDFLWLAGFTTSILIDFVAYTTFHFWFWSNSPLPFFLYHWKNYSCLASVTMRTSEFYFAFLIRVLYLIYRLPVFFPVFFTSYFLVSIAYSLFPLSFYWPV